MARQTQTPNPSLIAAGQQLAARPQPQLDTSTLFALMKQRSMGQGLPGLPPPQGQAQPRKAPVAAPAAPLPRAQGQGGDLTSALAQNVVYSPTMAKAGPGVIPMSALAGLVQPDPAKGIPVGVDWQGLPLEHQEALMALLEQRGGQPQAP